MELVLVTDGLGLDCQKYHGFGPDLSQALAQSISIDGSGQIFFLTDQAWATKNLGLSGHQTQAGLYHLQFWYKIVIFFLK